MNEQLRLGIEAAQAGQYNTARKYLQAVVEQEPSRLPALLWLAFIASTPQESIAWLERVLAIDPQNERAKAGLRLAQARLAEQIKLEAQLEQPETTEAEAEIEAEAQPNLRQQLFSKDAQKKGRKSVMAHRARRTINPFLILLILLTGVAGLTAIAVHAASNPEPPFIAESAPTAEPAISNLISQSPPDPRPPTPNPRLASHLDSLIILFVTPTPSPTATPSPTPTATATPKPAKPITALTALLGPTPPLSATLGLAVDSSQLVHRPSYPTEKWVEVNVTTQRLVAWEGDVPKMAFIVSTGLPGTPTVLGEFHVYAKYASAPMSGADYYLPGVPYIMYFYEGYALHGTYWHSNFGQPMSRGCVNLKTEEAKQLFDWTTASDGTTLGTLVVAHE